MAFGDSESHLKLVVVRDRLPYSLRSHPFQRRHAHVSIFVYYVVDNMDFHILYHRRLMTPRRSSGPETPCFIPRSRVWSSAMYHDNLCGIYCTVRPVPC